MKNIPELSCAIVEDLLPTYVERLTSEETNMAVEAHLASCPACAAKRAAMGAKETEAAAKDAEETAREVDYLNEVVGREQLSAWTANIAFAGFTAPKLLWMRKHEPENFSRIRKIMLPKDYITYVLTGVHCTDYSDASGTLLLDVEHRRWSRQMLDLCGLTEQQMPRLFESYEPVGTLKPETAALLGLSPDVTVCAGAGDNAAAAQLLSVARREGIAVGVLPGPSLATLALAEAGVVMTGAGATYPYGRDPQDSNIRIAPTYPSLEELREAMALFCICAELACAKKLLEC